MKRNRTTHYQNQCLRTLGGRVLLGLSFLLFTMCAPAPTDSQKSIAALLTAFRSAPPEEKVFMAQRIGRSGHRAAKAVLWLGLEDANERVVIATIQGLSAIGGDDVTSRIAVMVSDPRRSDRIRIAAASGLGTIGTPAGRGALVDSLSRAPSDELATQILKSLGRFKFSTVENTFRQILDAPDTPSEMRVAALEALARTSPEAVAFLLQFAQGDSDEDVRASAAWAISAHVKVNHLGPTLSDLVEREPIPEVRQRLYEALLPQNVIPAERLLPIVQAETEVAARVAGFNAIGRAAYQAPTSAVTVRFDQEIVPELVRIATRPNSLNIQMRAVFALRRAQTPAAKAGLTMIAYTARPQIATAARHGL